MLMAVGKMAWNGYLAEISKASFADSVESAVTGC